MKNCSVLCVLMLFFFCLACTSHAGPAGQSVERQDIAVTLEPDLHGITGQSTITYAAGTRNVELRLSDAASIDSVTVSGKKAPISFKQGVLSIGIPTGGTGEAVSVTIAYHAAFNDPVSRHPAASEDPSYGVNGAITREGTFLGGGAYWYPVPAQIPTHRSISIATPAGTEAVTEGKRVSRVTTGAVTRSVWEEARPVGVLSLCAGPYQIEQRRVGQIDLYTYLYPDNAALAPRYLDAAVKYLTLYSELFGPFPFEKFAVVENFFPTGYGFPSFTLLGGSVIRLPFIIDTSFPHEIAHSWWGNGIDIDMREGNWSEGLVTYLADYLLKERRSPIEARDYRRQLLIDYASLVTPAGDFPLTAFSSRSDPASRAIGYGKSAMLFHMVRSQIGDRAFFEALRQICRDHMYGAASWSDFTRAFSKSAGRDLSPFMSQWLTRSGGPRLSLTEVHSRREANGGWTVSGIIVQTPPLFDLKVPIQVETAGALVKEAVPVQREKTPFTISTAGVPARLLLDPEAEIFRVITSIEIPATVNSIKGSSKVVGVRTENCRASQETFKALLASLSQGEAPIVTEAELGEKESGRDLVFCGMPRKRSLFPSLPEGIDVADAAFSVDGAQFPAPDALLFLALQRPATGRVAALFHPLSEAAAAQYVAKITHYGKYSHLVFAGGANRRKGTTAAGGAGVVVDLKPPSP